MSLLEIEDLRVQFDTEDGVVKAVDGVSFEVERGPELGIVGESGSGKSVANLSLIGLTRAENSRISGAAIGSRGATSWRWTTRSCAGVRGEEIAMIFQDPLTSLHPFYRVGKQIVEAIARTGTSPRARQRERAIELLELVGIPDAERRVDEYPHEFSGGMRQRAMIAMALALEPKLLIADEPTTALDVTIQAQILQLLERLQERARAGGDPDHPRPRRGRRDRRPGVVMYAGRIVEEGTLDEIFYDPQHPYTWGLLGSLTRLDRPRPRRLPQIRGQPPSLLALPEGCHFRPRCPHAFDRCTERAGPRGAAPRRARPPRPLLAGARAEARAASGRRPDRTRGGSVNEAAENEAATARGQRPGQALPDQVGRPDRPRGGAGAGGRRRQPYPSTRARRSAWSASRAAASRRSAAPSCS